MSAVRAATTPGRITLSPMTAADLPAVVALEAASFPEDPWPLEAFVHELSNEYSQPVVAWDQDGTLIGYMINWFIGPEVHVANIAVDPECRGQGLGREMMKQAIRMSREAGAEEMVLEVRVGNIPAINLYLSLGFQKVYIRKFYYRNGEDAIVMALALK